MSQTDLNSTIKVTHGLQTDELDDLSAELFLLEPRNNLAEPLSPSTVAVERDSTFRRLLGASDILAAILTLIATASFTHTPEVYWSMFVAVIVIVPIGKLMGLYDRDAHVLNHTTLDELPKLFTLALMTAVAAFIARDLAVVGRLGIGSRQLIFLTGLLTLLLCVGRVAARFAARASTPAERLLIVGSDKDSEELRRKLDLTPNVKATVVGRVPIAFNELPGGESNVLGTSGDLRRVVEAFKIDRVLVIPGDRNPDEVTNVVRAVKSIGVKISLMPQLFDAIGFAVESDEVGGENIIGVRDYRMTSSSALIKRATDMLGAAALLIVASPIMLVAAIAIKLDSRGPVLFKQKRIGRGGEEFEIFKFRTMRVGAEQERLELAHMNETDGLFKVAEDPRVTRVGKFLRKTSLDELPQVINVLIGNMSLVGPRPLVPMEDVVITGWYRRRSQLTPGITGVWQLHGPVRAPLEEMVKLDYLYVANWSWWSDIKIMLRTARHIVARRGL